MELILIILSSCIFIVTIFIVTIFIIITSTLAYDRVKLHTSVLEFIYEVQASRKDAIYYYTRGNCYKFFLLLKERFPRAKGYYNSDHVITKIGNRYYDITGQVNKENHLEIDKHFPNTFTNANR